MSLFQWGNFTLHSGEKSWWRIDCDALTESEIQLFAKLIAEACSPFSGVLCPPSHPGSAAPRLVAALRPYADMRFACNLIVDDVLTTGASMEEVHKSENDIGAVIFARGKCPDWIVPIFQLGM